ncbi:P-loop containing nucleoside triphosphate hydrolase protein [Didymella exigua CBS 183.55]|uniref:P-loop containing nucleoside triphosphate hydrolase protein n=1 Tax=Didymella exigua CBS 183.55 TaxID=1150837 RepID=A0A6A5RG73_9PLEO|nr:P-loop containing nucleoside triphosphate hydrolase protein [Didymella exigua CBS 183.55]KAF1926473.1 P-loop containing nucleoside triphosphate hydrolase protein [Didymella exigua CBS 183.55]
MRQAFIGITPVALLCFDISSVESFENVERRWNHEADLYPGNVSKILVGCKKDLGAEAVRSVWVRDAYKMTAKINANVYFETSAVTKEGLEALFSHVAQISAR